MPIPNFPNNLLTRPFAEGGTYRIVPDAESQPGSGRASLKNGFPTETQLPLNNGGVAPNRTDFNGILYMLSSFAFWQQSGGQAVYSASLNYAVPNIVFHNGQMWWCLAPNGPEVSGVGPVAPGTNAAYWKEYLQALAEAGGNSTVLGNPVGTVINFWGTAAPNGYLACDGSPFSATIYPKLYNLLGSAVTPDLRGYFVRGYDSRNTVDPDGAARNIGSAQGDAIRNITGDLGLTFGANLVSGAFHSIPSSKGDARSGPYVVGSVFLDASHVVPTAAENRPKNVCLLYCIKHD